MDVCIKFIDGEEITIHEAKEYDVVDGSWRVEVEKTNLYFNESQVKYIGDKCLIEVEVK